MQYKQYAIRYTIFDTEWGYFGLAGTENTLLRTHLPASNAEKVKSNLLKDIPAAIAYNGDMYSAMPRYSCLRGF